MIFGVNTIPEYRRQGCAEKVMQRVILDAKNQGISESTHGGAVWFDMRLTF